MMLSRKKKHRTLAVQLLNIFCSRLFKNVRPGIQIGVIAGREQVKNYMSGAWWNNDPVTTARNIHINWGGIHYDG